MLLKHLCSCIWLPIAWSIYCSQSSEYLGVSLPDATKSQRDYGGSSAIKDTHPKLFLNPNLMNARLPITYLSFIQLQFFAHFKNIEQLIRMICTKEISGDLRLGGVLDAYTILHSTPVSFVCIVIGFDKLPLCQPYFYETTPNKC